MCLQLHFFESTLEFHTSVCICIHYELEHVLALTPCVFCFQEMAEMEVG